MQMYALLITENGVGIDVLRVSNDINILKWFASDHEKFPIDWQEYYDDESILGSTTDDGVVYSIKPVRRI